LLAFNFFLFFKPPIPSLAQQQLAQQVTDDEVMGQDDTLHKNLRSVYIQSEATSSQDVKVLFLYVWNIHFMIIHNL